MDFTVNAIGICATLDLDILSNTNTNELILEDKKVKRKDLIRPCLFFFLQYF